MFIALNSCRHRTFQQSAVRWIKQDIQTQRSLSISIEKLQAKALYRHRDKEEFYKNMKPLGKAWKPFVYHVYGN